MPTDTRAELETKLGKPLSNGVWQLLSDDGYVDEYENATCQADRDDAWKSFRTRAKKLNSISGPKPDDRNPGPVTREHSESRQTGFRTRAMEALVASYARTLPEVKSFRRELLQDRLLTLEEASEWIESQPEADRSSHRQRILKPGESASLSDYGFRTIPYAKPGSQWAYHKTASKNPEEPLGRLGALAEKLQKRCHWTEASAVMFVLTDMAPGMAGRINWNSGPLGIEYITLEFPAWYHEEDVCRMLRQARGPSFLRDTPGKPVVRRSRALSERIARLVVFTCRHMDGEGRPSGGWKSVCAAWNADPLVIEKQWSYPSAQAIASDFNRAAKRLGGA